MNENQTETPSAEFYSEKFRLAVPLMTKQGIPPTPKNYAVWFRYVSGENGALNERIDQLIADKTRFTDEINEQLFDEFLSECNLSQLEQIRHNIQDALRETATVLTDTGSDAARYGETLEKFGASCSSAESIRDVYGLLTEVLQETRKIKHSFERVTEDFQQKSNEMNELRAELEQVRKQASRDSLTGLTNRATFFDLLKDKVNQQDDNSLFCLVMMDIDHFKRVNDTFGHLVGDKVIRFVAETLKMSIKGQDTAARFGGEEFVLLLPDTGLDGALALCNNIRERIAETKLVRTGTRESLGQITISAGVAQYRRGEDQMDLIQRADDALYKSKKGGRNRVTAAA
ncbi:MAG TPA: diguanylate cyclase [Sedimenticola sp.]|nr:diguanylate cyclase [Sedimenticola sp.]